MKLCRYLRWKGHRPDLTSDEVRYAFARNGVPYSCLQTCQPWGPDDDVAAPETCTPTRACFRPDEQLTAPTPETTVGRK